MPESPREDAGYARPNIVVPGSTLEDPALTGVPATAKTQHQSKLDSELVAIKTRATAQGVVDSSVIKRAAK